MTNTDWFTLTLVLITAFYAYATFKILRANEAMVTTMRDQQNAAMRPYIIISANVRMGTQLFYLSIKNVGMTAAIDLSLSMDKNFYQFGEKREERNIANRVAFSQTINSLPPDGQFLFLLGNGPTLYGESNSDELSPLLFTVTANYRSITDSYTETSVVDLRPYINTDAPYDPIVEELRNLRQEVTKLAKLLEK
ncbi:MAG TPA: hypothetical protein PKD88_07860 [Nitrosomonas sp.]|nr:hypothetical protein [Nitrosomonas sp.]HMW68890.1 hypothetical protein [Nitrosomonas sp.]HMY90095.1 hypothetical protein [Nitrosomonas sp.]HNA69868.1 hypothetical protein [Nitrosomonas sp.]HNB00460.1 hypothetical protein [Nitrosomonas sp.]